jgi:hypothetical protein
MYAVYAVFSGNIDMGINNFIWRSLLVTKLVAFRGQNPVVRNIVTKLYSGSFMSYEKVDIGNKFNSYLKVTGVINNYN